MRANRDGVRSGGGACGPHLPLRRGVGPRRRRGLRGRRRRGARAAARSGADRSCDEVPAATRDRWGGIDVLVANAVQWPARAPEDAGGFEHMRVERWPSTLRTNLEGTFATVRAALPAMRDRDAAGRIVLISSGLAEEGMPGGGDYGAAKAGLHGLARSLAWELGGEGILVDVVDAGFTLTERNLRALRRRDTRARGEGGAQPAAFDPRGGGPPGGLPWLRRQRQHQRRDRPRAVFDRGLDPRRDGSLTGGRVSPAPRPRTRPSPPRARSRPRCRAGSARGSRRSPPAGAARARGSA
jgi:NAD(P)-dependent dehydrogenase (short-subunit alcohol dehydrogenase family)